MELLIRAVNSQKCIYFFKKVVASLIIFSMLMIDVAKAMDEESDPKPRVVQKVPSPAPMPKASGADDRDVDSSQSMQQQNVSSEDEEDIVGSVDSSPEKRNSLEEKKPCLAIIPFTKFSPLLPGSQILPLPPSQSNEDNKDLPSSLPAPGLLPSASQSRSEPFSQQDVSRSFEFSPLEVGSLEQSRLSLIANLSKPQEQRSIEQSLHHPLDDSSDSDSEADIQIVPVPSHHQSHNIIIRFPNEKKPLSKSRNTSSNKKASPVAMTQSFRNLLMGDGSSSLFSDQPHVPPLRVRSDSIQINDEQSPILEHSSKGSRYASIQANDSLYEEFVLLGDDQDPPILLRAGDNESRHSCCCNRHCWPQHTEYILPEDKIRHSSQILKLISYHPSQQIAEESFSPPSHLNSKHDSDSDDPDNSNSPGSSTGSTSPESSPTKASNNPMPLLDEEEITDSEDNRVVHPLTGYSSDDEDIVPADFPSSTITIVENKEPSHISSHLQPVLDKIEDLEAGLGGQSIESFLKFSQELQSYLKSLPAKTKAQLKDYVHQILNGKSTWPQRLGKWVIGPIIGAGFSWAMAPIYDGGLVYLYDHYGGSFLWQLTGGKLGAVVLTYIQLSALPDSITRNAHLWKKGIAYLSQEEKEVGRMCLAGSIALLTSFIPLAFLISAENIARTGLGLPNWDNVFGLVVLIFGPPVYLDAFASDFNTAWTAVPQMKEWLGKLFCRKSLHSPVLSLEETQREKFDSDLGKLKDFLFRAPQVVIDEIYKDIKQIKESLETSFCSKPDEDLGARQAFAAMSYLLSLGDEVHKEISKPKSIYDISADIFKYACLTFGSFARPIALQFIGYSVFSLFCPDLVAQILGGAYALLAFLPQTFLEDLGMDNFSKRFLIDEDSHGHSSHHAYRIFTKLYCAFQGLVYVFPLAVLTLQAFQQWSGNDWWPFVAILPFLIPEFAAQTYSFNGTFNQQVATAITNIHSAKTRKCFGKKPAFEWKRDWLIRFIDASRGDLKHWRPDLIQKLTESIEIFKQQDAQPSFDEV